MTTKQRADNYSVVLVEYFSGEHLISCLDSLQKQTLIAEEIIIVINGIDDDFRHRLQVEFENVKVIDPKANLGYSRAANLGISACSSPIVLTLNPDTILEKDACEIACKYLSSNPEVGAVGPQILESNGGIYPSARNEPSISVALGHALFGPFFPNNKFSKRYKNLEIDLSETKEVDWLSGAAIFLRRDALDEIGGWDERFFMYCEDIDLGRSMRTFRWKNMYVPKARITHVQGVSTSRTPIVLLIEHHKSLYKYASKKYSKNIFMKIVVGIFIAFRLPLALLAHVFRIN